MTRPMLFAAVATLLLTSACQSGPTDPGSSDQAWGTEMVPVSGPQVDGISTSPTHRPSPPPAQTDGISTSPTRHPG